MAQPTGNLHPVLRGSPRYPSDKDSLSVGGSAGTTGGGVKYAGKRKGPKALNRSSRKRIARKLRAQRTSALALGTLEVIDLVGPRGWSHDWVPGSAEALAEKLHWNEEKGGEARAAAALHGKGELSGPERKIIGPITDHPGHFEKGHAEGVEEANRLAAERKGLDPEAVKAAGKAMEERAKERLAKQAERQQALRDAKAGGASDDAVQELRARQAHEMLHGAEDNPAVQHKQEQLAAEWNRKQAEKLARRNERAQAEALGVKGPIRHGGKPPAEERAPVNRVERRARQHEAQAARHVDRAQKAHKAGRHSEARRHEQAAARSQGRAHGLRAFFRYIRQSYAAGRQVRKQGGSVGQQMAAGREVGRRFSRGELAPPSRSARRATAKAGRAARKATGPSRGELVRGAAKGIGGHAAGEARAAGRGVRAASGYTGQNLRRAARAIQAEHQANQRLRQRARQPVWVKLAGTGGEMTDLAVQVASTTDGPTSTRKTGMGDLVNHVRSSKSHGMRIPRGTTAVGLGKLHRALHRKGANHTHKQGALVGGTKQVAGKEGEGTKAPATGARKNKGEGAIRLTGTYETWGRALDLAMSNVGVGSRPGGYPGGGGPAVNPPTSVPMTTGSAMLNHLGKAHGVQLTAAALNGADAGAVFRLHRQAHLLTLFPGGHHEHPGADLAGSDTLKIDLAVLKAAQRKKVPSSKFGLPSQGKYPMPDKSHAANAKSRAAVQLKKGRISRSQYQSIVAKANRILGSGSKAA